MSFTFEVDNELPLIEQAFIDFLENYPLNYDNFDTYVAALMFKIGSQHSQIIHFPVMLEHLVNYQKITEFSEQIQQNAAFYSIHLSRAVEDYLMQISYQESVIIDLIENSEPEDIKSTNICHLESIQGSVVRVNINVPEISRAVYRCSQCGQLQKEKFVFLDDYLTFKCENCGSNQLILDKELSKIDEQQKIRLETPTQQINCILYGQNAHELKAGDPVRLVGFPVPLAEARGAKRVTRLEKELQQGFSIQAGIPGTQFQQEQRGGNDLLEAETELIGEKNALIQYKMAFYVTRVIKVERGTEITDLFMQQVKAEQFTIQQSEQEEYLASQLDRYAISSERLQFIEESSRDPLYIKKLIASFAPFIQSNDQVKLAIMLELVKGCTPFASRAEKTRAEINILLVGDPSTAKSQFLKYVSAFSERAIYASGKSVSAAGLTAAVAMDPDTGEWGIEPGAMLRASGGICCLDEFQAISQQDITSLHEAMEEEEISISKAGVSATFDTNTSVLAAMNPIFGRYNEMLTLKQNVNIGSAILSRFDLVFILCDEADEAVDRAVAERIIAAMRGEEAQPVFPMEMLREIIKAASCVQPIFTTAAQRAVKEKWLEMRQNDLKMARKNEKVTIRQLESLIRLSEAYCKLMLSKEVTEQHVFEAYELYRGSIVEMQQEKYEFGVFEGENGTVEAEMIEESDARESTQKRQFSVSLAEIDRLCIVCGFAMQRQGIKSMTFREMKELVFENLPFQNATSDELYAVADAVIKSMVNDQQYLQKTGDALEFTNDDVMQFTHLAPVV